jgi:1-acyl-sn-glycerol-3-phosphate acyltransferase
MRLRDYNRYAGRLADKGLFQENYRDFMTSWSKMLFDVSATCVVATGLSNILQGGVNVFAATHTSNLIEYAALFPLLHFGDYTFLAKAKLRDSALIGNIVSHSDRTIFVQRGNPESHQGTLDAMTDTLMEGRNLLLNPSGTRAYGRMQRSTSRWPRFQRQDGDIFRRPLKWGLAKAVLRAVHQGIDVNVIPVILNGAGLVSAVGSSVWGHLMHMPIQGNQTIDLHFASGLSVNRASLDPTDDEANEARIMDHVEDAFRRHYRAPVTARNALVA